MFSKKDIAKRVKDDLIATTGKIKVAQAGLDKLNAKVLQSKNRYYDAQIDVMEYGDEPRKVINDVNLLTSCIDEQEKKLRRIINQSITKMSSKRITTHINWYSKGNDKYNHGQLILYTGGVGYIPSCSINTVHISNVDDIFHILNSYGDELVNLVPTKVKQDVLSIVTKYAKIGIETVNEIKFAEHKCSNKLFLLSSDSESNYSFVTKDINKVAMANSRYTPTTIWIEFNGDGSYSSDKIYLNRTTNAKELYKIAINWKLIRSDVIKIKNILTKVSNSNDYMIKNLTVELSPYLLALTL